MSNSKLNNMRALIMDDNEHIRNLMENYMMILGIECDCVEEGAKAIDFYKKGILNNNNYDFVILDWEVKNGLGGKETFLKLKKLNPNIKAILCTGYFSDINCEKIVSLKFSDVISKPFNLEILKNTIEEVLELKIK